MPDSSIELLVIYFDIFSKFSEKKILQIIDNDGSLELLLLTFPMYPIYQKSVLNVREVANLETRDNVTYCECIPTDDRCELEGLVGHVNLN